MTHQESADRLLDIATQPADLAGLEQGIGERVRAVFAAGLVGGEVEALVVWLDLSQAHGADLSPLRHALALEGAYLEAVAGFESVTPPSYPPGKALDMAHLSAAVRCDRPLCLLALVERGAIRAGRDYTRLDVVHLQELSSQIEQLTRHMGGELAWGRA